MDSALQPGRDAFARRDWATAFAQLSAHEQLCQDDLERLAVAAHLVGQPGASELAWEQAHRLAVQDGDADRAARCAFWLGFDLLLRGESARASGWLARAERVAGAAPDGATRGLLLLPRFLHELHGGDVGVALDLAEQLAAIGQARADADLLAFGLLCQGEARLALGQVADGMRHLDEAMVSITTGEVSPIATGIIYCAVIDACVGAQDLRRAAEWTDALSAWCGSEPGAVPYRGQCLVHRSQILMARGAWDDASAEAERACAQLAEVGHPALGYALYQQGELHRVRGDLDRAELAYRAASRQGREPNPGFCLLRMAQGHLDDAAASARRMLDETRTSLDRPAILAAVVEVLIAARALDEALTACDELDRCAAQGAELLRAMASKSRASLLHASGDDHSAAVAVRGALVSWRRLDMPFEEARTRALAARILTALGDRDAAELERQSAQVTFERLAARTELADLRRGTPSPVAPLTERECEVLRLVAIGSTNRDIADALVISEHTVARHMQNIFAKLGVSSRAAATAWAYEHRVV